MNYKGVFGEMVNVPEALEAFDYQKTDREIEEIRQKAEKRYHELADMALLKGGVGISPVPEESPVPVVEAEIQLPA